VEASPPDHATAATGTAGVDALNDRVAALEAELVATRLLLADEEAAAAARVRALATEVHRLRTAEGPAGASEVAEILRLGHGLARSFAPPGSLRRQAAGYADSAVRMGVRQVRRSVGTRRSRPESREREATPAKAAGTPVSGESRPADDQPVAARSPVPLVSVIMPLYNARRSAAGYLGEALASVAAQTYRELELIVVDDGSTDDSASVVAEFAAANPECRLTLLHKDNGGQSSARNFGARHAQGEWLGFLDQDDLWTRGHLAVVAPLLSDDVDLVYTDADTIDAAGTTDLAAIHAGRGLGGRHPITALEDALFRDVFVMPGVMTVRKALFESLGGFDETLSGYEDDDLFVRAVRGGRVAYVNVPTLKWRHYDANYSRSHRMVESRSRYWTKLMNDYGDDRRTARRITLRFVREFLTQCSAQLDDGNPQASRNLSAALPLLPYLGPVDRAAFALSGWAWTRRSRAATRMRWWFINGLEPAA